MLKHIGDILVLGEEVDRDILRAHITVTQTDQGNFDFGVAEGNDTENIEGVLASILKEINVLYGSGFHDTKSVPTGKLAVYPSGPASTPSFENEGEPVQNGYPREVTDRFNKRGLPAVFEPL